MYKDKLDSKNTVLLSGIVGSIGALMILIADIVYNLFDGGSLGAGLYITTYFGVFCFALWWAGIWVIYKGLKPAGFFWSLPPCLLLAFSQSTINVFRHSSYVYNAVINDGLNSDSSAVIDAVNGMKLQISNYTGFMNVLPNILELIIMIWFAIPILRGKTLFPRWIVLLFPVFPIMLSLVINSFFSGFYDFMEPYMASGFMFVIFIVSTIILYKRITEGDNKTGC